MSKLELWVCCEIDLIWIQVFRFKCPSLATDTGCSSLRRFSSHVWSPLKHCWDCNTIASLVKIVTTDLTLSHNRTANWNSIFVLSTNYPKPSIFLRTVQHRLAPRGQALHTTFQVCGQPNFWSSRSHSGLFMDECSQGRISTRWCPMHQLWWRPALETNMWISALWSNGHIYSAAYSKNQYMMWWYGASGYRGAQRTCLLCAMA